MRGADLLVPCTETQVASPQHREIEEHKLPFTVRFNASCRDKLWQTFQCVPRGSDHSSIQNPG